jgi:hypothetical protein
MRSGLIELPWSNGAAVVGWVLVELPATGATSGAPDATHATRQPITQPNLRTLQDPRFPLPTPRPSTDSCETERAELAVQAMRIRLQSWRGVAYDAANEGMVNVKGS